MSINYTVTTTKGEFVLKREEFSSVGISIYLPEFLKNLSEEDLGRAFPTSEQPVVVRACAEHKVSFMLNTVDIGLPDGKDEETAILELFSVQEKAVSRLTPGYQEYSTRSKNMDGHTIICLEYRSHALEDDVYNIFFLFVHEGKMIYGTFSCLLEDAAEMNLVFLACLDTLQFEATE